MADNALYQYGNARPLVNDRFAITIRKGLQKLASEVSFTPGCSSPQCTDYSSRNVSEVVTGAQMVIVCLGLGKFN